MSQTRTFRIAMCIGIVSAICQIADGELITPINVTAFTSESRWPTSHLIDDSGLSVKNSIEATHAEATDDQEYREGNAWVTPHLDNYTDYYAWAEEDPVLIFELGDLYSLHGIVIWNYSPPSHYTDTMKNCAESIRIEFSQDGVDGPFGNVLSFSSLEQGYAGKSSETIRFEDDFLANAVRLTITDNYYDGIGTGGGGDRVGLSEVKFLAPEPGSFVLLLSFSIATWLVRRCRASGCTSK